ncbi:phosphatidylglycerol--membrane-oligosaccharide glycerophosphotransferase [Luminiphilus syltensis NOR5-1B]|uniref:Phosphatidylglycerol--membrane-oligosaccharide glycerophosphotransferase n=1 Tax=Luminiphilus syltensis NOR5-1B TaxID=565045 RepID=B8KTJ8_9GAMM|nr:sulfatase-like hydrolase/transferase [Luminiphilus syltensis]EED36151.1 phosphatidylglycerol--membrane-oligosaccharide glycerophosphotransferase [Luminiphilus syltensis NOR5-1B]
MSLILTVATLALAAVALCYRALGSRWLAALLAGTVFSSLLLVLVYLAADQLSGDGINEAVIYHLDVDILSAGLGAFIGPMAIALVAMVTIVLLSLLSYRLMRTDATLGRHKFQVAAAFGLVGLSFYLNPASADLYRLYESRNIVATAVVPPEFVQEVKLGSAGPQKNIVHIYLESVERTYFDETIFPGLVPNLKRLEKEAISFTAIDQVIGTEWTIAGMTAAQCGIPLLAGGNTMSGADQFLPGANCMGDMLHEQGYHLNYLGGAALDFAGKGNFYTSHQFDDVQGREELVGTLDDPEYLSSWGLYDDSLFAIAEEKFDALAAADAPFVFFMLTLDTHNPIGHVSERCEEVVYGDGSNPILNAVHCADQMAAEFIERIRGSDIFDNTLLVVSSDHLAMTNSATELLETGDRKNLLMFFGNDLTPASVNTRGSTIDVGPTMLTLAGYDVEALGFGRDLLRSGPKLFQKKSRFNNFLSRARGYFLSLWSFPGVSDGVTLDSASEMLVLGDREVRYPALFLLNEDLSVSQILFDFNGRQSLQQSVSLLEYDQPLVWVDDCHINAWFADGEFGSRGQICAVYGSLGSRKKGFSILADGETIPFDTFETFFDRTSMTGGLSDARRVELEHLREYSTTKFNTAVPDTNLLGSYIIKSAGGHRAGSSYLQNTASKLKTLVPRGVSLLGINSPGEPVLLANVDTCSGATTTQWGGRGDFGSVMSEMGGLFGAFVVIAHDSALCSPFDFEFLFQRTGLSRWNEIGWREPYIGIISGNGAITEYVETLEQGMVVEIEDFVRPVPLHRQQDHQYLPMVLHADGWFEDQTYRAPSDTLTHFSDEHELFEITLSRDDSGALACVADPATSYHRVFGHEAGSGALADVVAEPESVVASRCSLSLLESWLAAHPDKKLVLDVPEDRVAILEQVSEQHAHWLPQVIPMVHTPLEYHQATGMGFDQVIWTLSSYEYANRHVLGHIKGMNLYGLAIPSDRGGKNLATRAREDAGVLSWVRTVNKRKAIERRQAAGVASVFTDWAIEKEWVTFELRSAGYEMGRSYAQPNGGAEPTYLKRGLTLIGFSIAGTLEKVAYIDSCNYRMTDTVALDESFAKAMAERAGDFETFAILAHDSALCAETDLDSLFGDSPLALWPQIDFREPYIGIVPTEGEVEELFGGESRAITRTLVVRSADYGTLDALQ